MNEGRSIIVTTNGTRDGVKETKAQAVDNLVETSMQSYSGPPSHPMAHWVSVRL